MKTFYFTVYFETESKRDISIYEIENNKPECVMTLEVEEDEEDEYFHSSEEIATKWIKENYYQENFNILEL